MFPREFIFAILMVTSFPALGMEGLPSIPDRSYSLNDLTVEGSNHVQLSLIIRSEYPKSAVLSHYYKNLSVKWMACLSDTPGWTLTNESEKHPSQRVHQIIRYWVNPEDRKMLTILARHLSSDSGDTCVPQDNEQHAVVLVSHSPNLEKEISLLKLTCGLDTNLSIVNIAPPAQCP